MVHTPGASQSNGKSYEGERTQKEIRERKRKRERDRTCKEKRIETKGIQRCVSEGDGSTAGQEKAVLEMLWIGSVREGYEMEIGTVGKVHLGVLYETYPSESKTDFERFHGAPVSYPEAFLS